MGAGHGKQHELRVQSWTGGVAPRRRGSFLSGSRRILACGDALKSSKPVILLSDLEGFRNSEIAAILGVSLSAVKIRLHRARKELKKKLEVGCDFYRGERNEIACDRKAAPAASSR